MPKGFLLIVRGLPGSGKTSVLNELTRVPHFSKAVRLDPDVVNITSSEFERFCGNHPSDLPMQKKVYRYLLYKACDELTTGKTIIWEQPWRNQELLRLTLENIVVIAYKLSALPENISKLPFYAGIVEISVSELEARKRVIKRFLDGQHKLLPKDIEEFIEKMEAITNISLPLIQLDSVRPITELVSSITGFVAKIKERNLICSST